MGIDIPDIRTVIHMGIPSSLEDCVQEAGRDGQDSRCILLHDDYAVSFRQRCIDWANPPEIYYTGVWEFLNKVANPNHPIEMSGDAIASVIAEQGGLLSNIAAPHVSAVLDRMDAHKLINREPSQPSHVITLDSRRFPKTFSKTNKRGRVLLALIEIHADFSGGDECVTLKVQKEKLSKMTGLTPGAIYNALRAIQRDRIVNLEPAFTGKIIRVPECNYGEPLEKLLPLEQVLEKRNRDMSRLDQMIKYITCNNRRQYIRDYFASDWNVELL